ncbi:MAG TPA: hypothetical protein VGL96_12360, partial [Casimicrobiaceae bacterium]
HRAVGALDVLLPGVPALTHSQPLRRPLVFTSVALALLMMSIVRPTADQSRTGAARRMVMAVAHGCVGPNRG